MLKIHKPIVEGEDVKAKTWFQHVFIAIFLFV